MKIVDNWKLIRQHLDFSDPDKFYFIQLQQRKKDDNTFPANNRTVKSYFIFTLDEYDAIESEAKRLSDETCSRVYIRLNRRSSKDVTVRIIQDAAKMLQDNNFQHLKNIVGSCAGEICSEKDRTWIVDLDTTDEDIIDSIYTQIQLMPTNPGKILFQVPTLNGVHLITTKFDSKLFSEIYPNIDLHKDNPTLLYFKHE